jgi:hypothetical protein
MTLLAALLAPALLAGSLHLSAASAGDDPPEVIRLKVGTEVVGTILPDGFDEAKGIRIRRVDDDSILDIDFDQMLAEDARRIRGARGYLPDDTEPILVEAARVKLMTGDELLGVIVEQDTEGLKLRQGTRVWPLKRAGIREIVPVRVDALEVMDPEEMYGEEVAKRSPTTALDHYNLALFCESLQLWTRVKEHLTKVQELDPAFKTDIVSSKSLRADVRLQSAEDSSLLAKAQRFAQRNEYDAALALLADFLQKKPNSGLRADFEKTRRTIAKGREKWVKGQVILYFFINLEQAARQIAGEADGTSKAARKRMEGEATNLALEATAKKIKIKVEEARAIWEDPKRPTASWHYGNYGAGTWTLRDMDAVLKDIKEDPAKAANAGKEPDNSNATLEDKIKKLIEQKKKEQEDAAKKAADASKQKRPKAEIVDMPPTEEDWWPGVNVDARIDYLLAWWADHDLHVQRKADVVDCAQCTGLGILRYFDRGGDDKNVPCPRCKGAQKDRIVKFR